MAVNWTFGEAFLNQMQERMRLDQQRDQYIQDMAYKNRQQSLQEKFQLAQIENMNADNLRQQKTLDINTQKAEYDISKDYTPVMSASEDPRQYKRYPGVVSGKEVNKSFNGMLNPLDENTMYIPRGEKTTGDRYETKTSGAWGTGVNKGKKVDIVWDKETNTLEEVPIYEKPEKTTTTETTSGGKKGADISGEVGDINKLLGLYTKVSPNGGEVTWKDNNGQEIKMDYKIWKAYISKPLNDAMTKAGVPMEGDLVAEIRDNAGIKSGDSNDVKEKKLLDAIDYARTILNDSQYEALRYWAKVGTK